MPRKPIRSTKLLCFLAILGCNSYAVATGLSLESNVVTGYESSVTESIPVLTVADIKALKHLAEKEKLEDYSGVLGTAPKDKTVSATGAALEETPSGPQMFLFWTQTLANGFYYEARLYGKYNMRSQNPAFPDVPPSAENNPPGYKEVLKLGYNFHVTPTYDITPYLRLEQGNNVTVVYADTNGNYIHSTDYAILPGFKQTFKLTPNLTPYIDIYGGLVQSSLNGVMTEGNSANQEITAGVAQYQLTTELGFAFKISEHQAIIPYTQFVYTANNPDSTAAMSYSQGGFNLSQLSSSQQVYAIKYAYSF